MTRHGETGRDAASSVGTVIVTETSVGGDTQQIAAEPHRLVADEHGRKRWPLERIRVTLRGTREFTRKTAPTAKPAPPGSTY